MRNAAWGLAGLAVSLVFVCGIGILTIQRTGLLGGAVYDLSNQLVWVTAAGPALLPLLAVAALSALVVFVLVAAVRNRPRRSQSLFRVSFAVATAALIGVSLWSLVAGYAENGPTRGFSLGVLGWIEEGGTSSVVHVVLLFMLTVLWVRRDTGRTPPGLPADAEPAAGR